MIKNAMDKKVVENNPIKEKILKHFFTSDNPVRLLFVVIGAAVILGSITGYVISLKTPSLGGALDVTSTTPKTAGQDTRTFRDFAEGVIKPQPTPKNPTEYYEGTHILEREGAVPVTLTSSVVDLSKFEGKRVKVFGETQKALKAGWLMDVGKVEEIE